MHGHLPPRILTVPANSRASRYPSLTMSPAMPHVATVTAGRGCCSDLPSDRNGRTGTGPPTSPQTGGNAVATLAVVMHLRSIAGSNQPAGSSRAQFRLNASAITAVDSQPAHISQVWALLLPAPTRWESGPGHRPFLPACLPSGDSGLGDVPDTRSPKGPVEHGLDIFGCRQRRLVARQILPLSTMGMPGAAAVTTAARRLRSSLQVMIERRA
jgi:hypothetical protein